MAPVALNMTIFGPVAAAAHEIVPEFALKYDQYAGIMAVIFFVVTGYMLVTMAGAMLRDLEAEEKLHILRQQANVPSYFSNKKNKGYKKNKALLRTLLGRKMGKFTAKHDKYVKTDAVSNANIRAEAQRLAKQADARTLALIDAELERLLADFQDIAALKRRVFKLDEKNYFGKVF
ncbi:hypothetical protein GGS21DRAFT_491129 [Xylaria nigripes]|nr:hypothetical protein GGS21DRAFT_491129 [Xylaria nigripes]